MEMQRINMDVPRALWRRVKIRAAEEGRMMREIVAEALERYLEGEAEAMTETTWVERWRRREIDRRQAETEAWASYVGGQSVDEFVRYSLDEGITDIDEMARRYVEAIPSIWPEISREELPADLADLLAGYIRRQIDAGRSGAQ